MSPAPDPPARPHPISAHGHTRVDPYYWLAERDSPEVLAHLEGENGYVAEALGDLKDLTEAIYQEIKWRVVETDTSVPVRKGPWWYYGRTREGLSYPISCRAPAAPGEAPPVVDPETALAGEQVVLDENAEAEGHDFLSVGVLDVSPDHAWVAVGVDFAGSERHRVTIRPLAGQPGVDDAVDDVYYGWAWAADSRHAFYTRVDDAMRPWQVWRHELGTDASRDARVWQEDDPQFSLGVGRTRDDAQVVLVAGSSTTTEARAVSATDPVTDPATVLERRPGVEASLEHFTDAHGGGWWLAVTNDAATDFRLVARPAGSGDWREVVAERPGTRLDGADAFAGLLVISERLEGANAVRVAPLAAGDDPFATDLLASSWLVEGPVRPSTIGVGANAEYVATELRVGMTSMVTPGLVADVDLVTRERTVRKQQPVRGYDPSQLATGRLWVEASDGVCVPVTVVARADLVDVGDEIAPRAPMPLVLYGYGSYEHSIDPAFSVARLSLLERGVAFAVAHVRGGGEMGRRWYEMGRLAQKPTTFSDYVAVARHLVAAGWTTPERLAARGGSAGGLLVGAALNAAPELFRCAVAEVPFVDVLTTMLDPTLPLTAGEWEEWGDPITSPTAYRTIAGYSPYDNVARDAPRRLPELFVTAGLNDSRVGYWEPAKWVLAVRHAHPDNRAYLKVELGAGHGGPSGRYAAWRAEAQVLAFLGSRLPPTG
ncbi:MAG TPA: S9 family peptidase [Acidimicrobiales bacterium]|nr:S9 family peptidase [Acidimicrobiales bacterium]